jgi:hypothetical protein
MGPNVATCIRRNMFEVVEGLRPLQQIDSANIRFASFSTHGQSNCEKNLSHDNFLSPGSFGGIRAQAALRPFLAELGLVSRN